MMGVFMFTSVAFGELPGKVEQRATGTIKGLDGLKNEDISKFEGLVTKVTMTYIFAKREISQEVTAAKTTAQKGESTLDSAFEILKTHATQTYGELKDKVIQALDNAHKELTRFLKIAETGMASAEKNAENALSSAEVAYETATKALGKKPTHEQFVAAVQKLEDGLTKTVDEVKQKVDEVTAAWGKESMQKLDDDINRTITGSA